MLKPIPTCPYRQFVVYYLKAIYASGKQLCKQSRLTQGHVQKRVKWAKEYLTSQEADWRKIGWSDECSIEKSVDPYQVWVSQCPEKKGKIPPQERCTQRQEWQSILDGLGLFYW